jgi:hypothetical protein
MAKPKIENTLTWVALTGGVIPPEDIQYMSEKTEQFIKEKTPPFIKAATRSLDKFRKTPLARKLLKGVAYAALLSGYATTGMGHVVQTVDKITPDLINEAQKVWANTVIETGSNIGSFVYKNMPAKETVEGVASDIGQLTNAVAEATPSTIKEPVSRIGKHLASFAHQETAKLIPESMTQGTNAVPILKRLKETAGR